MRAEKLTALLKVNFLAKHARRARRYSLNSALRSIERDAA